MARLLLAALRVGGHRVEVVSTLRSFLGLPDAARQASIEAAARVEAERIDAAAAAERPDLWLTYHPFYKAPDLLGPALATRWGTPYATAEASHAPKRASGGWANWHLANEAALRQAAVHFCFTDRDSESIAHLLGDRHRIVALPPFIDAAPFAGERRSAGASRPARLVTVAMMRTGDKMRSFAFLAEALTHVPSRLDWSLTIVGDGPARPEVEAALAMLPTGRVMLLGALDASEVGAALRQADVYVWPGFNEAYGVSYLEAGAAGLPCLAMCCGGIPSVIEDGVTGLLTPEGDRDAFVEALSRLIAEPALRVRLGQAAHRLVAGTRTVKCAAAILDAGFAMALKRGS